MVRVHRTPAGPHPVLQPLAHRPPQDLPHQRFGADDRVPAARPGAGRLPFPHHRHPAAQAGHPDPSPADLLPQRKRCGGRQRRAALWGRRGAGRRQGRQVARPDRCRRALPPLPARGLLPHEHQLHGLSALHPARPCGPRPHAPPVAHAPAVRDSRGHGEVLQERRRAGRAHAFEPPVVQRQRPVLANLDTAGRNGPPHRLQLPGGRRQQRRKPAPAGRCARLPPRPHQLPATRVQRRCREEHGLPQRFLPHPPRGTALVGHRSQPQGGQPAGARPHPDARHACRRHHPRGPHPQGQAVLPGERPPQLARLLRQLAVRGQPHEPLHLRLQRQAVLPPVALQHAPPHGLRRAGRLPPALRRERRQADRPPVDQPGLPGIVPHLVRQTDAHHFRVLHRPLQPRQRRPAGIRHGGVHPQRHPFAQRHHRIHLQPREYLYRPLGSQVRLRGLRTGRAGQPAAHTPRARPPVLPLLRQPAAAHSPPHGPGGRTLRGLPAPPPPLLLQHPAPLLAEVPAGGKGTLLPPLLADGAVLPLPAFRLPLPAHRLPHAQHRRLQAALVGALRSGLEALSGERTAGRIGLLQDTPPRRGPEPRHLHRRCPTGPVHHDGQRRQLWRQGLLLQHLEALDAPAVLRLYAEPRMVSPAGRPRQAAFALRHPPPAGSRPFLPDRPPLFPFAGRYRALGADYRVGRISRPASAPSANAPATAWTQATPFGKTSEPTSCCCSAWACTTSWAIRPKKRS